MHILHRDWEKYQEEVIFSAGQATFHSHFPNWVKAFANKGLSTGQMDPNEDDFNHLFWQTLEKFLL